MRGFCVGLALLFGFSLGAAAEAPEPLRHEQVAAALAAATDDAERLRLAGRLCAVALELKEDGRLAEAEAAFARLAELVADAASPPLAREGANALLQRGLILLDQGRYVEAEAALAASAVLGAAATDDVARRRVHRADAARVGALVMVGRHREAAELGLEVADRPTPGIAPDDASRAGALLLAAESLRLTGRLEDALAAAARTLAMIEGKDEAWAGRSRFMMQALRADALRGLARPAEALAAYEDLLSVLPPRGEGSKFDWAMRARAEIGAGNARRDLGERGADRSAVWRAYGDMFATGLSGLRDLLPTPSPSP